MPDPPIHDKRTPVEAEPRRRADVPIRYAELHCKTNFTFLTGASHADELVARAWELGYEALAVTDTNSLAGIVRAHAAAKRVGLKLIVGAELTPIDGLPLVVWATDRAAYGRLCRLLTVGRRSAEKGECRLTVRDIAEHAEGLLAGAIATSVAGHPHPGPLPAGEGVRRYAKIFGNRLWILAELFREGDDAVRLSQLIALSKQTGVPLAGAGDVHYHARERQLLHDVVTAIRCGTTVDQLDGLDLHTSSERHLRDLDDVAELFATARDAIAQTMIIADRCMFSLDELRYEYPHELTPDGSSPGEFLERITWMGAKERYPDGVPEKVDKQIKHELALIGEMRYEAYFLTVWDLVRYARSQGILCQGRGSAANSAVCYVLGVTSVDPTLTELLFERFISRERGEAPDIDVDFEHQRREEVLQYLYNKYGRDRAGLAATVISYRIRSAIRDAGKALGLSLDAVDALAKQVDGYHHEPDLARRMCEVGIDPESAIGHRLHYAINNLVGFPRHLSQHVGGMVMTEGPLCELVPIENAAMADRTIIQWDKDDLESLGLLKVDVLALGMLTAIRKCFDLVEQHHGRHFTLATIPPNDTDTYDMICRADTLGVFQIESRAQMSMLPRLRPRKFYDLVIEVAIVRPGPIQGQMVHPYLRRRAGEEAVDYPNEAIRQVLEKTMGVPIFQEQAMRLAVVAAGFTPGEADQLRRAMAAFRKTGVIDKFRQKLIDGMRANGLSEDFAQRVYQQLRGFGEYGFPESHAASFALLVYASCWLKCHYHAAFTAAMINSQPLGFYAPAQLVTDARQHGIEVLPVDVNHSDWDCTLAGGGEELRLGMRMIAGLAEQVAQIVVKARGAKPFASMAEFISRTKLPQSQVTRLSEADAFGSLGSSRRDALWHALGEEKKPRAMPLFEGVDDGDDAFVTLPAMPLADEVLHDYRTTSLSLKAHPMSFHRDDLHRVGVTPAAELQQQSDARHVKVAGLVLLRQRPATAKGITFVTLEDETGTVNLIVHAATWDKFYNTVRRSPAWIAEGELQLGEGVIHVVTTHIESLGEGLTRIGSVSRDFR